MVIKASLRAEELQHWGSTSHRVSLLQYLLSMLIQALMLFNHANHLSI